MPLARYTSSAGDLVIMEYSGIIGIYTTYGETPVVKICVPWSGTIRYRFWLASINSSSKTMYIKINTTEYGPYSVPANSYSVCNIDYAISSPSMISIYMKSSATYSHCKKIALKTGNADCMYKATICFPSYINESQPPYVIVT